jgi:hypothetical protein
VRCGSSRLLSRWLRHSCWPPPPNAARPTTEFTGSPGFVSTPSAGDSTYREVSLKVTFTHQGTVAVRVTATIKGVTYDPMTATYRARGSDSLT